MEPRDIELGDEVFNIADEPMPKGAWWWWFWLFFFDNPKDPEKPRQLMILWSTKNVKKIKCNDLKIELDRKGDRSKLDGAVAAWYFDGERMRHNYLLEQCNLAISKDRLSTDSSTPTSFTAGDRNVVRIGKDMEFVAEQMEGGFNKPHYYSHKYIGKLGYSMIRSNGFNLTGTVDGRPIRGSAYFQRVFVTAPAIPWYWGIFHFESGQTLTYFRPHVLGKALKKDIKFFDGKKTHKFFDIRVIRSKGSTPKFRVSGESEDEKIAFVVDSYAHSSWTFTKRSLGIFPNKLVYNEYPSVISAFRLEDKRTGNTVTLKDLGKSVGNAEHTTGLLM
jgi:hypothetical protein